MSGQKNKNDVIDFRSSINLFNLYRLESRLRDLESPEWPFCLKDKHEYYLPASTQNPLRPSDPNYCGKDKRFDEARRASGERIYIDRCQACHTVIDRTAWDRIVVAHMSDVDRIGTDSATPMPMKIRTSSTPIETGITTSISVLGRTNASENTSVW